jgi:hypothetical protein
MKRTRILKVVKAVREELNADYLHFYCDSRVNYSPKTISGLTMKWYGLRYARKVAKQVNKRIRTSGYTAVVTENTATPGLMSMHIERIPAGKA